MTIDLISSRDSDEIRTMHTKSDNIEIMMGSEADDIIKELFESLLQKIQKELKEKMRGSEFVFDSLDLLHYNLHKISLNRGRSNTDPPEWPKEKKATINPQNNDDEYFQYALTLALDYQNIKSNPERIPIIKPFIDQYNSKETNFPSHQNDWKKFELNIKSIALNILFVPYNTEEIKHAYNSKYNLKRENQVILLMTTFGEKWHYHAVKKLSALLSGITSKHDGKFYCLKEIHLETIIMYVKIMIIIM